MSDEYRQEMEAYSKLRLIHMLYERDMSINELKQTIDGLKQMIDGLNGTVDGLNGTIANLNETISELRRKIYGSSSEKTRPSKAEEAVDAENDAGKGSGGGTVEVSGYTRARKPKAAREDLYGNLPVVEEVYPVPEESRVCGKCGAAMSVLQEKRYVREEIRITPAKVERVKIYQEVLVCMGCRKEDVTTISAAETPMPLLPHSPASASIVSYVAVEKYGMYMPSYRQEKGFRQLGIPIPRETQANWLISCSLEYLQPIYDHLKLSMVRREVIHADEVPCQVLREEGREATAKSYLWIYVTGNDGEPGIILYEYQPGRNGEYPAAFLKGFSGFLECDGYSAYNKVENVTLVCCLAHARRKFFEAIPVERRKGLKLLDTDSEQGIPWTACPTEETWGRKPPAETGLDYCNHLFFLERMVKDKSPEERKAAREVKQKPVWDSFWKWLSTLEPTGGSKLEKAVNYALNHRETLMNYMKDGRCEISNNRAERRAKSYVQGRKNFLFHNSVDGAKSCAILLSIIETAKANDLNIFQYLYTLLLFMPDYKNEPKAVEVMMPWSDFIKERCSGFIDTETVTPKTRGELPI